MTPFSRSLKFACLSAALILGACTHKQEAATTAPPPAPPPAAPAPAPVTSKIIPGSAEDFRVKPADLHITTSPITIVTVNCATPWTNHGSVLIVKGRDGLLAIWDGAVFELERRIH